jgi:hypothetical protein
MLFVINHIKVTWKRQQGAPLHRPERAIGDAPNAAGTGTKGFNEDSAKQG